jgi:hypothetical protein
MNPGARALFFILYGLTFFFCNFGPNVTTFVIPSEVFPAEIRATSHGISAAIGKAGALVGGAMMPAILRSGSVASVMYTCAAISVLGLMWTAALTRETKDIDMDGAAAIAATELAASPVTGERQHEIPMQQLNGARLHTIDVVGGSGGGGGVHVRARSYSNSSSHSQHDYISSPSPSPEPSSATHMHTHTHPHPHVHMHSATYTIDTLVHSSGSSLANASGKHIRVSSNDSSHIDAAGQWTRRDNGLDTAASVTEE